MKTIIGNIIKNHYILASPFQIKAIVDFLIRYEKIRFFMTSATCYGNSCAIDDYRDFLFTRKESEYIISVYEIDCDGIKMHFNNQCDKRMPLITYEELIRRLGYSEELRKLNHCFVDVMEDYDTFLKNKITGGENMSENIHMASLEEDKIIKMIEGMSDEERTIALSAFSTQALFEELMARVKGQEEKLRTIKCTVNN